MGHKHAFIEHQHLVFLKAHSVAMCTENLKQGNIEVGLSDLACAPNLTKKPIAHVRLLQSVTRKGMPFLIVYGTFCARSSYSCNCGNLTVAESTLHVAMYRFLAVGTHATSERFIGYRSSVSVVDDFTTYSR